MTHVIRMDRSRLAASAEIADFEAELLSFPNGRFDDQVDTDRNCSIGCTTISVARRCRVDTTAVGKPVQVRPVRSISAHSNLPAFMYLLRSSCPSFDLTSGLFESNRPCEAVRDESAARRRRA